VGTDVLEEHAVCMFQSLPWWWRQYASSKHWYPPTVLHGVIHQKTVVWIFTYVKI